MRYLIPALALSLIAVQPAPAQQVAPGWFSTGEWQCGPYVRIITSTDGRDGMDFLVIGAWFDNHYVRIGRPLDQRRWRPERWQARDQRRESHPAVCSPHWIGARP